MAGLDHVLHEIDELGIGRQCDHLRARHHDVADGHVGDGDGAFHHAQGVGRDQPVSLRIARLLLVGAAAGAFGLLVYIAALARSFSVPLVVFLLSGVALAYAARSLGRDLRRGRLLAIAGGLALAATGVLAGFGAGNLSLPIGALGILAAWAAVLHPPRRAPLIAFGIYVAIGLLLTLPRGATLVAFPWLLSSVLLWPWTSTMLLSASFGLPIFASIGVALALGVSAFVGPLGAAPSHVPIPAHVPGSPPVSAAHSPITRSFLVRTGGLALAAGAVATAAYVSWANARPQTSARFELDALPLVIVFAGGALLALGVALLRAVPAVGLTSLAIGATVAVVVLLGRPTVECHANGVSTTGGPWWLPRPGGSSSGSTIGTGTSSVVGPGSTSGGTSEVRPTASTGEIRRGDGIVIRYRCGGNEVVEFTIQRP